MDLNRNIGKDNNLPWYLPNDLNHFKTLTMDKTVVMGRKTWESIGKPLSGRMNIILTHDKQFKAEGATVIHDIRPILRLNKSLKDEVFIIGGSQIYNEFLPYANFVYITIVEVNVQGDAQFPQLEREKWEIISSDENYADDLNAYNHTFYKFRRIL